MHLLSLADLDSGNILELIGHASKIKGSPGKYNDALKNKTMLMIFEKPSLRTRVSFEAAMTQLGGHAIYLDAKDSPLGEKESIADTAKVSCKYCDIIMARLFRQEDIEEMASNSNMPVINGLTDIFHPCQILSDLLTINEKKSRLKGLKLSYLGDGNNNVTHELLLGCSAAGIDISIGCPKSMTPQKWVVDIASKKAKASGSKITLTSNPKEAVKNADIIYTDTWMSYHIPKNEKEKRIRMLKPYQVNEELMKNAKKDAIFMHCLPARRGNEVAAEVIDGVQSVVFDQAENRLHMQKAIILKLLNKV